MAARFGGNANYAVCSPRNMNANNAVSNTNRNNCGLALCGLKKNGYILFNLSQEWRINKRQAYEII